MFDPGNVLTFKNGMVGCITKTHRLALVNRQGCAVSFHRMPSVGEYVHKNDLLTIERSPKEGAPFELLWDCTNGEAVKLAA